MMMMQAPAKELVIRPAIEMDAPALLDYFNVLADEPYNNTKFRASMLDLTLDGAQAFIHKFDKIPNSVLLLAFDSTGGVVGLISATAGDNPFTAHNAELSINIHPAFRGQGLSSRLFKALMDWAKANGNIRRIFLEVLCRNDVAIRLYERQGFVKEGHFPNLYYMADEPFPTYQSSLIMAKYL